MVILTLDNIFLVCAGIGGFLFIVRIVFNLFGLEGGEGVDVDLEGSDSSFQFLSLQSLSAFLLMFGLIGLALHRQSGIPGTLAIVLAIGAGVATVLLVGRIVLYMNRLQSSELTDLFERATEDRL